MAENDLGDDSISKEDEDEYAKEFCKRFSYRVSDSAPEQVWFCLNCFVLWDFVVDQRAMGCVRGLRGN
jgi:hypothetical protein